MAHWGQLETDAQRALREARTRAFWDRNEDAIWRDLIPPEEDLPASRRGGPYRWFKSPNVADLGKIRKARARGLPEP